MSVQQFNQVAYGLSQALINEFPAPVVSVRSPTINDKAKIGTLWVNTVLDGTFILTSIANNQAFWLNTGGGAGDFSSITVDPGSITVTDGDITVALGNLTVTTGSITCGNGLTITDSPLTVSNAGIQAHGEVVASSDIISTGGSVYGLSLIADGDIGSGFAGNTAITNVFDTAQSTGTLAIKSKTTNAGNNTGFLKIYVGATVAYLPYFTDIAP